MEGMKLFFRISIIVVFLFAFMLLAASRLYSMQIINGDKFLEQSERKITRQVAVNSSRGEILDRYGRPLVTNKLIYVISFDTARLYKESPNETILRLIELCGENGLSYTDTLPISEPPFIKLTAATEQAGKRFDRYMEKKGWSAETEADEIIGLMAEEYKLDGMYSERQTRQIVGIRYELEIRSLQNLAAYTFAEDIDIDLITKIKEQGFTGVKIDTIPVREYKTEFAAHILGRVGLMSDTEQETYKELGYEMDEKVGKDGMEKALESWLRGKSGTRVEETNSSGKVTNVVYSEPPEPGDNCILTIDLRLQEVLERSLSENIPLIRETGNDRVGGYDAEGAAAVAIDVNTGEILAMASYPTYKLDSFGADFAVLNEDPLRPMYNRAAMGVYEPGSTFKMAVATAALEEEVITSRTRILDKGIYTYYAPSYTPQCHIYRSSRTTHGNVNAADAIRVSCNYFFYEVGRLLGIEKMNEYATGFGLGQQTGVELPERMGVLASPTALGFADSVWNPGLTLQAAIGQQHTFSPLQIANYIATLANGGTRYNAHLLKSVKSYDYAETIYDNTPQALATVPMSADTHKTIKDAMLSVSKTGTASTIFSNYFIDVGSKTGSAQTGGDSSDNGVFVCFAPYDKPEIAVAVIVEKGGQGGRCAPIARDVLDAYFKTGRYLDHIASENTLLP